MSTKIALPLLFLASGTEVAATPTGWAAHKETLPARKLAISGLAISDALTLGDSDWNMCGAYDEDDDTTVYFGPCTTTASPPPLGYYKHSLQAAAFTKGTDTSYLEDADLAIITVSGGVRNMGTKMVESTEVGYVSVSGDAYSNSYGAGVTMGSTSFLTLSGDSVTVETNDAFFADTSSQQLKVDPVTYSPGVYKFSLYGLTTGAGYQNFINEGYEYLGFRTEISQQGCDDDCTWSATITQTSGSTVDMSTAVSELVTDVESVKVSATNDDGSLSWSMELSFPRTYRWGTYSSGQYTDVASETDMKINMLGGQNGIYVDYLFPTTNLGEADRYFIYDPKVEASSVAIATVSLSAAVACLLFSVW